jgi:starch phosphorylase
LVQGVDLWINTPRRPWEASGTSGMKVLVNGGINLSELDGWWAEAYTPEVGWALGDGQEHGEDSAWDAAEADALYTLLEEEVAPQFYSRNGDAVPAAWVKRMRNSMARLTPQYSSTRTVREYVEQHYVSAAARYRARAADRGAAAQQITAWLLDLTRHWSALQIGAVRIETTAGEHRFEIAVNLGRLEPETVRVELFADGRDGGAPERHAAECAGHVSDNPASYQYRAVVPAFRAATDYTARVLPYHEDVSVPLEAKQILWQR